MKAIPIILLLSILSFPLPVSGSCISGDCQNGQGVYLVRNAYQYSGGFKNGKYHGDGVVEYFNPDNTVKKYRGYFKNHKTYGPGHIYYRNGDYYHGEFKSWFKPDGKGGFDLVGRIPPELWVELSKSD